MSEDPPDEKFDVFLRRSLSDLPGAEPPPGFARKMGKLAADLPDQGAGETFITPALVSLAILAVGACVSFSFDLISSRLVVVLGRAPWPLLATAAAVIGAMKMAELAGVASSRGFGAKKTRVPRP